MAALKYTTEVKKKYVQRYIDEGWESRNKFSIGNNINQASFNKWCLEYEKELRQKPIFARANVVEMIQPAEAYMEKSENDDQNFRISLTYGKYFSININLPQKYFKNVFRG